MITKKPKKIWKPISKEEQATKRKAFVLRYAKERGVNERSGTGFERFIARRARIMTSGHKIRCIHGCKKLKIYPQDFPSKEHGIGLCAACFAKNHP